MLPRHRHLKEFFASFRGTGSHPLGKLVWKGAVLFLRGMLITLLVAGIGSRVEAVDVEAELVVKENEVDSQKPGKPWQPAEVGLKLALRDKVSTGVLSRAVIRLADRSITQLDQVTVVEVGALSKARRVPLLKVNEGGIYHFSRERRPELELATPAGNGALRGTQLAVRVMRDGRTLITVFEGEVEFYNPSGRVTLRSGEQGEAEVGKPPHKTAVINAINLLQWALYYPAVINPGELDLGAAGEGAVAASLAAYKKGDLLGALEKYPAGYRPRAAAERLYRAAVVLAVGQVEESRQMLSKVPADAPGRLAIEKMIAAVNFLESPAGEPRTASEWLAQSYYLQSKSELEGALNAANRAAELSPGFGYAWTRVAELEFSFGRTRRALQALDRGMKLAPLNAQAHALRGFLLSAQNNMSGARTAFNEAIGLDGALANGWLGRGLVSIRQGKDEEGRRDLQIAAAVEPNRSILHAYLGKAFSQTGDALSADRDFKRAKELDPNDPTPWLYSALEHQQQNRYNEAVRELEQSLDLNKNRRLYRSRFLLDQDRAVQSANLADIYQNNGMSDLAVREATRAVDADYASAGAHLFLANAFDALRDPTRVLLRYETAWFNELLIANLISPVGGGPLSQFVSQLEYSKLFESDRTGFSSVTDYFGDGQLRETASQFGISGNVSYALDTEYFYQNGTRPNGEVRRLESYATFKLQLRPEDTLFLQVKYQNTHSGDLFQRYDPGTIDESVSARTFDFHEQQEPGLLLLGWHHEWGPGIHTLILGGRLADAQTLTARGTNQFLIGRDVTGELPDNFAPPEGFDPNRPLETREVANTLRKLAGRGNIFGIGGNPFDFARSAEFEIYSGELNQILTLRQHALVFGTRYQKGDFRTQQLLEVPSDSSLGSALFQDPAQDFTVGFQRLSLYAYDFWRVTPWLSATGGVSYDKLNYPENFRSPPINANESAVGKLSPKAGFILQPHRSMVLRGAYTQSLSGASFDESIRLEPTQIAGFTQASRSYISESVIGSVAGAEFETWGVSLEQKLTTSTYWGVEYSLVRQDVDRKVGVFDFLQSDRFPEVFGYFPSSLDQKLAFREESLSVTINQLVGDRWSFGGRYRYAKAQLHTLFGELKEAADSLQSDPDGGAVLAAIKRQADTQTSSALHQVNVFALYNDPSGFFARAEGNWYRQANDGFPRDIVHPRTDPRPGDDFWQFNLFVGWRFFRNQCEASLGVLNVTGSNYRLEPLNYYTELARDRTLFTRIKIAF